MHPTFGQDIDPQILELQFAPTQVELQVLGKGRHSRIQRRIQIGEDCCYIQSIHPLHACIYHHSNSFMLRA